MPAEVLQLYYVYSHANLVLGANATVAVTIAVLADADFAAHYITGQVLQANVLVANWGGTLQIDDTGVGRTFFNQAINFDAIAGDARQPYPMPIPRRVARNSTLVLTYVNNVATVTTVQLQIHGYKLYGGEGPSAPPR